MFLFSHPLVVEILWLWKPNPTISKRHPMFHLKLYSSTYLLLRIANYKPVMGCYQLFLWEQVILLEVTV